jgi:hypothetical protein
VTDDRRFEPAELTDGDAAGRDLDLPGAYAMARALERSLDSTADARPSPAFVDGVMAAIATEPSPARAGFLAPLRASFGLGGLLASVRAAWRVASEGSLHARSRAMALAYVFAVVLAAASVIGAAGYGTAGALRWLANPPASPTPSTTSEPGPTTVPQPSPAETAEPGESDGPAGGPDDSSGPDGTDGGNSSGPSASADDHGGATPPSTGTASPSQTDGDGGGGGPTPSSGETQTPKPSGTPKESQTPRPTETPKPTSTSGSGSGSGSDPGSGG